MGLFTSEYVHHFVEAKKLAFADRAKYYADPKFNNIDISQLISKEYAIERAKLISSSEAMKSVDAGILKDGDTIYLTTADKYGNMVSLIQSNYRGMGSGMVPPNLGFMLQDRGELFSLNKTHANSLIGGKRPFHTIIPGFVTQGGRPVLSFGVMGGHMQHQGHLQMVSRIFDFGQNPQEASDAPRWHVYPDLTVGLERGMPQSVFDGLKARGHDVRYERLESVFGLSLIHI